MNRIYERWSIQGDRSEKARALVAAVMEVVGSAAAAGMAAEGCAGMRKEYDKRRERHRGRVSGPKMWPTTGHGIGWTRHREEMGCP